MTAGTLKSMLTSLGAQFTFFDYKELRAYLARPPLDRLSQCPTSWRTVYVFRLERAESVFCAPSSSRAVTLPNAGCSPIVLSMHSTHAFLDPLQPWFFGWKYGDQDWNSPYLKMAPDDLHSVYGGVCGAHLPQILRNLGELLPMGVTKLLELLDSRLHRIYTHHTLDTCVFLPPQSFSPTATPPPTTSGRQFSRSSPL